MKYVNNILIVLLFALGFMGFLRNTAQAASPTILSTNANASESEVVIDGLVNPNGYLTTAWFEYGTTKNLLDFRETVHVEIGADTKPTRFSGSISKLSPDTTYYFRTAANNGQKTSRGEIFQFTTVKFAVPTEKEVVTPVKQEVKETKTETTKTTTTGLEANSVFGSSFIPSSLLGWLALLLVILSIFLVMRKLYSDNKPVTVTQKTL